MPKEIKEEIIEILAKYDFIVDKKTEEIADQILKLFELKKEYDILKTKKPKERLIEEIKIDIDDQEAQIYSSAHNFKVLAEKINEIIKRLNQWERKKKK